RRVQDAPGGVPDHHAAILAVLDRSRAGRDRAGRPRSHASLGALAAQPRHPANRRAQGRRGRSRKRCAMTIALETRGLEKSFGGLKVTRDLSLQVKQGARHALIGPNGAGKTTVINLLTGVLKPNGGRILLEGTDITDLPVHTRVLRGLSRTFQINQLYADLTPLETIGLAVSERLCRAGGWGGGGGTRDDGNGEIAETLARFHLLDVMNELTATLPYGKQRLLEIAVAIATRPRVLLLDEPAAGVPESERHDILAAVAALPRDVTVLLIEHDMDLVFSFADRISVLVNGAMLVEGPPDEGARDPQVKAVYLGEAADVGFSRHRCLARRLRRSRGAALDVADVGRGPGAGAVGAQRHRQDHADQFDRRHHPSLRRYTCAWRTGHHGDAARPAGAGRDRVGAPGSPNSS